MKLRYTTEEVIDKFNEVHKEQYRYDDFIYLGSHTKSIVTCPVHGDFLVTPNKHLLGRGCPKCANNMKLTNDEFKQRLIKLFGDKFLLNEVEYHGCKTKIKLYCKEHGYFVSTAYHLLQGHSCPKCGIKRVGEKKKLSSDECIERFRKIHGYRYDYSNVDYINMRTKVSITCSVHGEFLQTPDKHLLGHGCPKCKRSHLENYISLLLTDNNIEHVEQKKFSWLGLQSLDFYLPKYNIGIECQGIQHFEPTKHFKNCEVLLKRDELKYQLCSENNLKLLYYTDYNISDEILNKHRIYTKDNLMCGKEELLNKITNRTKHDIL